MNKDFSYYLNKFLTNHLSLERNCSLNTIRSYKQTFELLLDYLINFCGWKINNINFENITRDIILDFLNYLENQKGNSINTRNQRLGAIKSFYNYALIENVEQFENIKQILNIKTKKCTFKQMDYLSKEEVKKIFDSFDLSKPKNRRNMIILVTLYDTAARGDELMSLKYTDINFEENRILLNGKGKKQRYVPIMSETKDLLVKYCKENNIHNGFIFHDCKGKRNSFLADIIKSSVKELNINKKITPHTFRRTRATHLLESGVSIIHIKDLLGHESVQTTERYLKISNKYKNEAIKKANENLPKQEVKNWNDDKTLLSQLLSL